MKIFRHLNIFEFYQDPYSVGKQSWRAQIYSGRGQDLVKARCDKTFRRVAPLQGLAPRWNILRVELSAGNLPLNGSLRGQNSPRSEPFSVEPIAVRTLQPFPQWNPPGNKPLGGTLRGQS